MKLKNFGLLLTAAALTLSGCDDNTGSLGIDMLPGADGLVSHTSYFDVHTRSVLVDSVYAKTGTGFVGHFTDPKNNGFGQYEASFLTELNCTDNFRFPPVYDPSNPKPGVAVLAGDSVVATNLVLFYSTWYGDSLNACRLTAYTLDRRVDRNRYTNFDPTRYYKTAYSDSEPGKFVAHRAFSAYDTSVPDSVRNATNSSGSSTYYPNVSFPLNKEFGNWMLRLNRDNPDAFKNSDAFIDNVFQGVYVKNTYGDGTVLYVDRVDLQMQFRFHYTDSLGVALKKKTDGTDSLYYSTSTVFANTKEVIQSNRFVNSDAMKDMAAETAHTFIKSPAGIFTEATLPYDEIATTLVGDTINAVRLTFTGYRQDVTANDHYAMTAPSTVLLLRRKEMKSFFEENKITDGVTSFVAARSGNLYTFSNIAPLITTTIREKETARRDAQARGGATWDEQAWQKQWDEENDILLVPVTLSYDQSQQTPVLVGVQHNLTPGYAKLKGGDKDVLSLEVVHTSFTK
ncbi:MAG: DUF4270 domain-containing protein [Prevotellaceae bacterium]|jgi:hypothetical protein|nr:DUF4270 domain-containing protein [Prevotellaceae bacterium]